MKKTYVIFYSYFCSFFFRFICFDHFLLFLYSRIAMHEEKKTKKKEAKPVPEGAIPAYLMDRQGQSQAKALSNMIKQKRKEKAGKWAVPLPKVRALGEDEVMKVVRTGKTKREFIYYVYICVCMSVCVCGYVFLVMVMYVCVYACMYFRLDINKPVCVRPSLDFCVFG